MQDKFNKLIMSVVGLLISAVLLTTATFAWFAISTTPEIRGVTVSVASIDGFLPFQMSLDGENWTTELNISALLQEANVLRPISTYDGDTWYISSADAFGSITTFLELNDSNLSSYANTGNSDTNYLAYVDIYVTSNNVSDDEFTIVLSNPSDEENIQDDESNYGTYVLFEPEEDEDGNLNVNDAMAAFRIGFQFYEVANEATDEETEEDDTISVAEMDFQEEGSFYIYEPNADMRSGDFQDYLDELGADDSDTSVTYIYGEGTDGVQVSEYSVLNTDYHYTSVPVPADTASGYTLIEVGTETVEELEGASDTEIDVEKEVTLIRQTTSAWSSDVLNQSSYATYAYDSTDVAVIGEFYEDTPVMSTIEVGEIKKIRIYFWIEGQDIDCWNQIAGGNIYANLEFTGEATN